MMKFFKTALFCLFYPSLIFISCAFDISIFNGGKFSFVAETLLSQGWFVVLFGIKIIVSICLLIPLYDKAQSTEKR